MEKAVSGWHRKQHHVYEEYVRDLIQGCRDRLGVERVWSIEVRICCPHQLPAHEASIYWDPESFYARLYIRCSLSRPLVSWLVYHELCELQQWRTGSFLRELLQEDPDSFRQYQQMRNQEIECRIHGLLGTYRPGHILEAGKRLALTQAGFTFPDTEKGGMIDNDEPDGINEEEEEEALLTELVTKH